MASRRKRPGISQPSKSMAPRHSTSFGSGVGDPRGCCTNISLPISCQQPLPSCFMTESRTLHFFSNNNVPPRCFDFQPKCRAASEPRCHLQSWSSRQRCCPMPKIPQCRCHPPFSPYLSRCKCHRGNAALSQPTRRHQAMACLEIHRQHHPLRDQKIPLGTLELQTVPADEAKTRIRILRPLPWSGGEHTVSFALLARVACSRARKLGVLVREF